MIKILVFRLRLLQILDPQLYQPVNCSLLQHYHSCLLVYYSLIEYVYRMTLLVVFQGSAYLLRSKQIPQELFMQEE